MTEAWSTLTANLICSSEVMSSHPAWALHDNYDVVEYSSAPRDTGGAVGVHLGASVHSWSRSSTADDQRPDGIRHRERIDQHAGDAAGSSAGMGLLRRGADDLELRTGHHP
jgi:hypothetical protein